MEQLSTKTKIFIGTVLAGGSYAVWSAAVNWQSASLWRFALFTVLGVLLSRWKVRLPGVNGSMSVLCVLALVAVTELSLPEITAVVCVASLAQCLLLEKRRPHPVQVLFNVAVMAIAVQAAVHVFQDTSFVPEWHILPAVALMIAAAVFFLGNTLPIAVVISMTEGRPVFDTWRSCYFWSLPFYLVGAIVAEVTRAVSHLLGWQTVLVILPAVYIIYRSYNLYTGRAEEERRHMEEMSGLHLRTIETLALAIEAKDHTTANHLARVQVYAVGVGEKLGMSKMEIEALRAGALLHDIGKLAVPEYIISKPGKLTREEFEKMKIHPVVGAEILKRVKFPYEVTPIVRSHHEKWNGEGYPDGLKGEEIPLGARILAAVDCLDALASDRQYRKALPLDDAMAQVLADAGKSFDPRVVGVLNQHYRELERAANSLAAENEKEALSIDIKVQRGEAPAAGYESGGTASAQDSTASSFVESIAAARQEALHLLELARDLGNCLSLDNVASVFSKRLQDFVSYDSVALYLCKGDKLVCEYVAGQNPTAFSSLEIPVGMGLSGWVAENVKTIVNGNPAVEFGYLDDPGRFTAMRSALAVPLETGGHVVGVLTLYRTEKDVFSQDNLRVLLSISPKLTQAIENTTRYEEAQTSATTDYLTGLPNSRSLFLHLDSEVARCKRVCIPLTVLVGDLDGFKEINDQLGHLAGNAALREVADELRGACRPYDYVARMGGDEFVIVMPETTADVLKQRIQEFQKRTAGIGKQLSLSRPFCISFGSAELGQDGQDPDRLLAEADRRMYESKRRRKISIIPRRASQEFSIAPTLRHSV